MAGRRADRGLLLVLPPADAAVAGRTGAADQSRVLLERRGRADGVDQQPAVVDRRRVRLLARLHRAALPLLRDDGRPAVTPQATRTWCWAYDNATMSLNGKSTELIRDDATGVWKPKDDDGSKVEKLTGAVNGDDGDSGDKGEHWRITTTDGTQYYLRPEPPAQLDDRKAGHQLDVDRTGLRRRRRRAVSQTGTVRRPRSVPAGLALEPGLRRGPARQRHVLLLHAGDATSTAGT